MVVKLFGIEQNLHILCQGYWNGGSCSESRPFECWFGIIKIHEKINAIVFNHAYDTVSSTIIGPKSWVSAIRREIRFYNQKNAITDVLVELALHTLTQERSAYASTSDRLFYFQTLLRYLRMWARHVRPLIDEFARQCGGTWKGYIKILMMIKNGNRWIYGWENVTSERSHFQTTRRITHNLSLDLSSWSFPEKKWNFFNPILKDYFNIFQAV